MQPMMARRELDDTGTMDNWLALAAAILADMSPAEACMRIQGVESIKTDPENPEESQRRRTNAYYHKNKAKISIIRRKYYEKKKAAVRETAANLEGINVKLSTLSVTNVLQDCQEKEG